MYSTMSFSSESAGSLFRVRADLNPLTGYYENQQHLNKSLQQDGKPQLIVKAA
jgi:hypothetical protein